MKRIFVILALVSMTQAATAEPHQAHISKYAGQEKRPIKSLSADDIAELQRGGGWGLAKAAELNGVPGPIHLLEMREEIRLSEKQISEITQLFDDMKREAIEHGNRLIALERSLDTQFRDGTVTRDILQESLRAIAETRMNLRFAHLSTHLKTPAILTREQLARYTLLRGYDIDDPCAAVPDGHDAAMWRKHNGCR